MAATTYATLKMKGKQYVLVPKSQYDRLMRGPRPARTNKSGLAVQNAGDIAEAKRRLAAGGFKPYSQLRKALGLA